VNIAVIGVGHLGKFHLSNLQRLEDVRISGFQDINPVRAEDIKSEFSLKSYDDLAPLLRDSDAAIIATPATTHYKIAKEVLDCGIDLFVEKPLCCSSEQAQELIDIAEGKNCILQVGHIERYNPIISKMKAMISEPRYLEFFRIAPFNIRGTDTSVVMDLMIHDIDLLLDITGGESPERIVAHGASLFTDRYDLVKAHFSYSDGLWAELTASRVSLEAKRRLRLFQRGMLLDLDLSKPSLRRVSVCMKDALPSLSLEEIHIDMGNPLMDELKDFVRHVRERSKPISSGLEGLKAIRLAEEVICSLEKHS